MDTQRNIDDLWRAIRRLERRLDAIDGGAGRDRREAPELEQRARARVAGRAFLPRKSSKLSSEQLKRFIDGEV